MKSIIMDKYISGGVPSFVLGLLPKRLSEEIEAGEFNTRVEEIRIRRGRNAMLTTSLGTVVLRTVVDASEIEEIVAKMCDGSLYAYRETICRGYISLREGVRVGICGRAAIEDGRIIGVYDISSLDVRIPHAIEVDATPVCELLRESGSSGGILIYSPPGEGKTTLLRAIAKEMSCGKDAWRVAVVDSRGEIDYSLDGYRSSLDILSGYPKGIGIEIATRTLNAELIICDEIGEEGEVRAILSLQGAGVPIVASAHARSIDELLLRSGIRRLHESRAFFAYIGIKREEVGFRYDIHRREDLCFCD